MRFEDPLPAESVCVELPVEVCHYLRALGTWLLQGDLLFPLGALVLPCQSRLSGVFTACLVSASRPGDFRRFLRHSGAMPLL